MQRIKYFFYAYFGVLILGLTGIGVMNWLGYKLMEEALVYLIFGILVVSALAALAVFICRRIHIKWLKVLGVGVSGVVILAAAGFMLMFFTLLGEFSVPKYYNSFTSPSGKTAVVLRTYSTNEELRAQRPLVNDDGTDFLGLNYTAYPKAALFFYDSKRPGEGTVEIGFHSEAQLMYEWTDDDTLRLFIDNPQPGDAGEHSLKLAK